MPISKKPTNKTAKKDSTDAGNKVPDRKKPMSKKKGGGGHDDDESVDSRGNIRGLIDYDDGVLNSEEESFQSETDTPSDATDLTAEQRRQIRRSAKRAAIRTRNEILSERKKKKVSRVKEEEEEEDLRKRRRRCGLRARRASCPRRL